MAKKKKEKHTFIFADAFAGRQKVFQNDKGGFWRS